MIDFGVVAIGRNEGERLRRCLASLGESARGATAVYVDSGSTDASIELATRMGVEVVELDLGRPFSAARARNAGFERLKQAAPAVQAVMFIDGDCEIVAGWIERAQAELEARPDAAVICGRRRELMPDLSIYNRLADLEWETPIGEAFACGGDALMRVEAFDQVGGFNPTAAAGEEPELCQRLRRAGWSIWRIDAEMTRHDLGMTRFRQWWRRQYRSGYNGLDIATRFPDPNNLFAKSLIRSRVWAIGWPLSAIAIGVLGWLLVGFVGSLVGLLLAVLALVLQILRLANKVRPRVDTPRTALAYGILTMVAKWADVAGQVGYLIDRRRGRMARLIEYKRDDGDRDITAMSAPIEARS